MNQKDLCEHTRIRLIAAAVGHQQCTKTESTLIPLPGTPKFIAIGTLPAIAKVLMVEPPASTPPSTAPAPQTDELQAARALFESQRFSLPHPEMEWNYLSDDAKKYWLDRVRQAAPAPLLSELSVDLLDDLWQGMRTYHGGEPFKMGHLEFARAIEREVKAAQAAPSAKAEPVAYMVSSEGEPELGFWFSEEQGGEGQISKPLYAAPAPSVQAEDVRNQAATYVRAGWFIYEGIEWTATSSDDPRATILYRQAEADNRTSSDKQ